MVDDDTVRALTAELHSHVARHPGAADTVEGVCRWWLPHSAASHGKAAVEAALEQLVLDGALVRRPLPDGQVLYAARAP